MKRKNKTSGIKKIIISIIIIVSILFMLIGINYLRKTYFSNIIFEGQAKYIYIKTGASFSDLCNELERANVLQNRNSFEWVAEKKHYPNKIKPGRYKLTNRMSNKQLIQLLLSGEQEPLKLTFNNIRTIEQLAGVVCKHLETDSAELVKLLRNSDFLIGYYLNPNTAISIFIPNTYEFYWNTNANQFVKRMYKEWTAFWNEERLKKAQEIGLTNIEATILASIVDEETNLSSEYPVIAGVYMNRLKKGMMLQADPTIKFALGDFTMKRVLKKDIEVKSPYNTYKNKGLPPGPICMPSIKAIDGVLNYEHHKYLYFCAKADFSGYHAFANTLKQHNQNAEAYWQALNKNKIFN
jgi:UPF0755 protein